MTKYSRLYRRFLVWVVQLVLIGCGSKSLDIYLSPDGDVRLKPDSPAYKLGITSIDVEKIGLLEKPVLKLLQEKKPDLF